MTHKRLALVGSLFLLTALLASALGSASLSKNKSILSVTPADGLSATGYEGGPFSPTTKKFFVANILGKASISWSVGADQPWVGLSKSGGSLKSKKSTSIDITINAQAASLAPGTHTAVVTFSNLTNGRGDTTRTITLTVFPRGIEVTPAEGLSSIGTEGGPFSPTSKSFVVTNTSLYSTNWTVSKGESWLGLSKTGGTLAAGASDTVAVSIGPAAGNKLPGAYADTVTFACAANTVTRPAALTVNPKPIAVSPDLVPAIHGKVGGPFLPTNVGFRVTNTSASTINWSATPDQGWMTVTPSSGSLPGNGFIDLVAAPSPTLAVGNHEATISFVNQTYGAGNTTRTVSISVAQGTLWTWGSNAFGGLSGGGSPNFQLVPQQFPGLTDVVAVSVGRAHTIVLKSDGTVWGWGDNSWGQLGDGTLAPRVSPVQVLGLPAGVIAISAGLDHNLALTVAGAVWAWGSNTVFQLGPNGPSMFGALPVQVVGLSCCAVAIAAGGTHSLALLNNRTAVAWGNGEFGQLASGFSYNSAQPMPVRRADMQVLPSITSLAAGRYHSLFLCGGSVWKTGYNGAASAIDFAAVQVSGLSGVRAVAAGGNHSLALLGDGTVRAWGLNSNGQLGNNSTANAVSPVTVVASSSTSGALCCVRSIAAGGFYSLALLEDGTVRGWGHNGEAQLGNGGTVDCLTPCPTQGLSGAVAIAAALPGYEHSAALR